MRIVVTGAQGQVARALAERAASAGPGVSVAFLARPEVDLARPETIGPAVAAARPDVLVSAAAYTAVDQAEREPDLALAINRDGAAAAAAAAAACGAAVVHLSTDYVFDGGAPRPYREDDPPAPLSVYGATKLAGEAAVLAANPRCAVLRIAWVFSPFGKNFLKTMLRLATDREEVGVVADQIGRPTPAHAIADTILTVAAGLRAGGEAGVFHFSGDADASWADFAEAIFAASAALGGPSARVRRISTAEYLTPARRPANSRLDGSKLAAAYRVAAADWRAATGEVVRRVLAEGGAG